MRIFTALCVLLWSISFASGDEPVRREQSLDGPWEFRTIETPSKWKPVTVPSAMQSHEGTAWHGIGEYRKLVRLTEPAPGKRLLLHFTAVSTHATIWWNGERLGEHLGGWTPFRFDVTEHVKTGKRSLHELVVRVDERVGHNTQGFLPIVQPHFGGIWGSVKLLTVPESSLNDLELTVPANAQLPLWSPEHPQLTDLPILNDSGDCVSLRTARRTIEVRKDQLFLNGEPLQVRGVLNWGYYPPKLEPAPLEEIWRADLKRIRAWGFNLMKCCLWVPTQRQLEIADEEGVLIWIEYPTWHPQLTPQHLKELKQEFKEFFAHVRNHPSVVLHSLTCETGPSAEISVLQELTDLCKSMIPGAIVEDDSSWIEWNRITDFYDDHPYGNNHTWVPTLRRLRDYQALGVKPLLLGEAIAADTWTDVDALSQQVGTERPYWLPRHFQANSHWISRLNEAGQSIDEQQLEDDSKQYAMLMRKYQMETFRREVPHGGYVVSVLRDFPLAAMGLIDYQGREKWPADQWSWHGESMLMLSTPNDVRTFVSEGSLRATIVSTLPTDSDAYQWRISLASDGDEQEWFSGRSPDLDIKLPKVTVPTRLQLNAQLMNGQSIVASNDWQIWCIPSPQSIPATVTVARNLDRSLMAQLEAGARVLLLPDNTRGSLPLQSHWFLRGGPVVFEHAALQNVPRELLIHTQHFDLAGDVIPNVGYVEQIDPLLLLWDNHDIAEVRTHGLAFTTEVGQGRLLVSALNHHGEDNAVGAWLLGEFAQYLASDSAPQGRLSDQMVASIREKIDEAKLSLVNEPWTFQPDPLNQGLEQGWHQLDIDQSQWTGIKIDRGWEGQGHANLDGWAWYRLTLDLPTEFQGKEVYLQFTGVDDHYELFVNGVKAGSGGELETKQTAFEERKSHRITPLLQPDQPLTIAVRVYDWHGAGGIFRPIFMSTAPESDATVSFLK